MNYLLSSVLVLSGTSTSYQQQEPAYNSREYRDSLELIYRHDSCMRSSQNPYQDCFNY